MKRSIALILVTILLFNLLSVFASAAETDPPIQVLSYDTQYCTVVACNMRAAATTASDVVKSLSARTSVEDYSGMIAADVWSRSPSDWTRVTSGVISGYIRNDLICPRTRCYYVTANGGLNVRSSPSTGAVIVTAEQGARVYYTQQSRQIGTTYWWRVQILTGTGEGTFGWVSSDYLTAYCF